MDFEMQDEGYVAKLLFDAGTKDLPLGTVLAVLVEDEEDIAKFTDYTGGASAAPAKAAAPATPA